MVGALSLSLIRLRNGVLRLALPMVFQRGPQFRLDVDRIEGKRSNSIGQNRELDLGTLPPVDHEALLVVDNAPASLEIPFLAAHPNALLCQFGFEFFDELLWFHVSAE